MFRKLLVANRGEIAVRVMRTATEMGIRTVAVTSDVDRRALHALIADEVVCLGGPEPSESYLNMDRIIAAAQQTGAQAIHPGYGFLSENPSFASRVRDAGLIFVGPPAEAMAKLGNKISARRLMAQSGVPIIPGVAEADPELLRRAAEEIGYPVLLKAAAGGGGKGMRIVRSSSEMAEAAARASSEASSAFGDGTIYLEKYLDRPRHVEFQILADAQGNVVHCFERECSIQRRHQKIVEETPSPGLDPGLRIRMGEAACAAARAAGYVNAGTVEFLLDGSGAFYFLEVNTRLQVEHPITEATTGLDLVRHQLEIASGKPLPFTQQELHARGHAIECRIYAEDPEANFMPSPGKILALVTPEGPGVRFDHGMVEGFDVPVHYDPILGKLIVWAEDRKAACSRMIRALKETAILGVKTPVEFLLDVISSTAFLDGELDTHFLDTHFSGWRPAQHGDELAVLAYAASQTLRSVEGQGLAPTAGELPSPWQTLGGWDMGR